MCLQSDLRGGSMIVYQLFIGWSFCDLGRVDLDRVAFFVTCFSKQQIKDWRETDAQQFKKSWNKNEMHSCCCSCRIPCSGNPQLEQWPIRLSHSPHRHIWLTCSSIYLMFCSDSGCSTNNRMQQMFSIFVSTPHSSHEFRWSSVCWMPPKARATFREDFSGASFWLLHLTTSRTETKGLNHTWCIIARKQTLNSSDSIETSCSLGSAVKCSFQSVFNVKIKHGWTLNLTLGCRFALDNCVANKTWTFRPSRATFVNFIYTHSITLHLEQVCVFFRAISLKFIEVPAKLQSNQLTNLVWAPSNVGRWRRWIYLRVLWCKTWVQPRDWVWPAGEKEPIDKAEQVEDSEEEEMPTLDPMDEEAWQTQRFQKILLCFVDKNGLQWCFIHVYHAVCCYYLLFKSARTVGAKGRVFPEALTQVSFSCGGFQHFGAQTASPVFGVTTLRQRLWQTKCEI